MAVLKADKIISADIVHTDSGMLGGKPPEYYARADQAILPWQSGRVYAINDLCYEGGIIYRSKADNNIAAVTDVKEWGEYGGEAPDSGDNDYEQLINYTMLYNQGDECGEVTGGMRASSGNTSGTIVIKNNNALVLDAVSIDKSVAVLTAKSVDVSNFVKMHGIGTGIYALNADNDTHSFGLLNTANPNKLNSSHDERIRWTASSNIRNVKTITEVDISAVNQSCYPAFFTTNYRKAMMHNMFLTKADAWQPLCAKEGVTPLATLDVLLSDATAMTKIMTNTDAINYMVKQCTGDFMVAALQSSTFKIALAESSYKYKVIANPHWAKFMMILAPEMLNYTMLYDQGNSDTGLQKFYESNGKSYQFADENGILTLNGSIASYYAAGCTAKNKIDVSKYKKGIVNIISNVGRNWIVRISDSVAMNSATNVKNLLSVTSSGVHSFVINETGEKYVGVVTEGTTKLATVGLLKPDTWQTWAQKGNVTDHSTLSALLADSTALTLLMTNKDAIEYMLSCTGDLMLEICNCQTAMSALVNNIAYDYAFNHPVWHKFMLMCPVSLAAMDSVAVTVPTMTSNTMPQGLAFCYPGYDHRHPPHFMFDKYTGDWESYCAISTSQDSGGNATTPFPHYFGYAFPKPISLYKMQIKNIHVADVNGGYSPKNFIIQGSIDGINYVDIESGTVVGSNGDTYTCIIFKPIKASHYRLKVLVSYYTAYNWTGIHDLQFYGKAAN